jgi:DNA-binding transcriptional LysR family regulator
MVANIEDPDLNDDALFVAVVRAASFTAAAKQRGVPVSTVSRRIARLEARLDTRLLERTTRRLHLTDVGRTYFEHAVRALDVLAEGSQHVRAVHAAPHGRVRLTAPVGLGPLVTRLLASYLREAPDVTIELDLIERRVDLIAEGFDIAIRTGPSDSPDLVARKIFESARYLFASKSYLARRGRPARVDDLTSHDLVATQSSATGASWDLYIGKRRHRLSFKPRFVVNELQAARSAALAGIGITLLPTTVSENDGLVRVLPRISAAAGGLWVLYPSRRALTAAVRTCVDHLVRELKAFAAH